MFFIVKPKGKQLFNHFPNQNAHAFDLVFDPINLNSQNIFYHFYLNIYVRLFIQLNIHEYELDGRVRKNGARKFNK